MKHVRLTRQRGFSISEFMVAIAIGLFLIAGLVGMYIAGKSSYNTNEVVSRTQENARFSTDILTRYLRLADYRPDNEDERRQLIKPITDAVVGCIVGTDCGAGFAGNDELPAVPVANSHAIHVKYTVPYDDMRDCAGGTVYKNDQVTATFSVGSGSADDPPSLYCGASVNAGAATKAPLIQGVTDLKFEYGILSVIALRVLVTVESGDETLAIKAKEQLEDRPDRQFQATVQLRNRLL
jgi:Tfp pilus assembly protein PilW